MFLDHDLDVTTTEIVSHTDESDQSRRKLVELSRDFKKNTNEDVRKPITPILKSFPIEIDSSSKPSKITEDSFSKIYQYLSELADPVPALKHAQILQRQIEKVSDLEIQNQKFREPLVDVNYFQRITIELTTKQLRDNIKDLKEKPKLTTQQHIKEKEKFQHIFVDKQHIIKYAQMEMHQSPLDMFEYKTKQEDGTNTCSSNIDILEQANERVSNAERLVDKFCEEFEQTRPTNNNSDQLISQEETERKLREKLEFELAAKERQITTLVIETQKLQSTLIKIKETSFTQISDLENIVSGKEKLIAQLENKLQSQADYDEIKRELTLLKSIEFHSSNHLNDDQTGDLTKKSFEILSLEKNRPVKIEQIQTKISQIDSESNTNHQQLQHSCRHCTSPCLHRTNTTPFLPVPSLLSSSASSSSNSSSSPSSPSQIYLKTHPQSIINCNGTEEITRTLNESSSSSSSKFISPSSLSILTKKDHFQLCNSLSTSTNTKNTSITSSCSTMVTPTASLLSSVTTTTTTLTPSNLFPGHQLSSVQCTKLHCPPTSSWSPPLSSSSGVSSIATTSTDNRTVIKSSKQTSPKPSSSPTILVPSTCSPVVSTYNSLLEPLDTTYVANVVRKLLAQHNIGQRIFARYILSLSQGTVSELLSKPKCWSKLTEKGKESYRKMWCWANSEESILTLKSISPRKGMNNRSKDNPYPAVSTKHTDPATHQKIVQILADAQKQQMAAAAAAAAAVAANMDQKPLSPCSSLPNELSNPMPSSDPLESKSPSSSSASSTANSPLNESIPSDQQSFFLPPPPPPPPPSSSSAAAASLSMLSAFVPSLLMRTANGLKTEPTTTTGNLIDCSTSSPFSLLCHQPDNYRNWLMLQEIVRNNDLLKQFQPTFPPLQPLPIDTDDESEQENDDDDEEEEDGDDDDDLDDDENFTNSDEIPLDLSMKMDSNHHDIDQTSITISNKQQQSSSSSSTKHTKTALTPLREQDTSKYRYINTMELVQTVKDILSRYSISQRHFGEKILGLSQGSVSDILARPKQWELLTQKGREPFLRMRIFLDDPNAIKQLVQTVSTTPTTNTSSILLPTFCPPLPPSSSTSSSLLSTPSLLSNSTLNGFHSNNLLTKDNSTDSQSNILTNDSSQILINENIQSLPAISSSSPSNGIITTTTTTNSNKSKSRSKNSKTTNEKSSNQSRNSSTNPLMTPYELPKISLPNTIDTEQLSSQVRELLFAYSIGQRVFGEAVLNLSQGTVSEILSKPRPWHSLSVKGREPYIRMYTWYNDTGNVQKLLAWKRERDALRRSRPPVSRTITDNGDTESGNNNSTITNSSTTTTTTTNNHPKRRYLFTDDQRRVLKQIFENEPYPSQATLEQLVGELSLPMNKIANWFHNSRMRAKTNIRPLSSPTNRISTSSINNNDDLINTQTDDEDDLDDNNNNNNNNDDDDDDDDYPILPTIVPLTSSWLNGTNDSNSSTSPIGLSATSTTIVSLIDDQKMVPISSLASSSSKKRKSVPQKIVTNNNPTKKFHNNSTIIENNDSNDETNQTTNESTNYVDILT